MKRSGQLPVIKIINVIGMLHDQVEFFMKKLSMF